MSQEVDDISVVLVSNSSLKVYPENTITNFKNNLHTAIELPNDDDWYVGVSEISYTKSWMQLPDAESISIVRQYLNDNMTKYENSRRIEVRPLSTLPSQHFDTINQLVNALNEIFISQQATCSLKIIGNSVSVETTVELQIVTTKHGEIPMRWFDVPLFSDELSFFLGLHLTYAKLFKSNSLDMPSSGAPIIYSRNDATSTDIESYLIKKRKAKHQRISDSHALSFKIHTDSNPIVEQQSRPKRSFASRRIKLLYEDLFSNMRTASNVVNYHDFPIQGQPIDIMNGMHSLFVYGDVCQTSRVGDSLTQLLTIVDVPMNANFGEQVYRRYEIPQFQKVSRNYITDIEIDIRDSTGAAIVFEFGRVILKLIFRCIKRKNSPVTPSVVM